MLVKDIKVKLYIVFKYYKIYLLCLNIYLDLGNVFGVEYLWYFLDVLFMNVFLNLFEI